MSSRTGRSGRMVKSAVLQHAWSWAQTPTNACGYMMCNYMVHKGSTVILATKISTGLAAKEPRADVTMSKSGVLVTPQKDLCPSNIFKERKECPGLFFFKILQRLKFIILLISHCGSYFSSTSCKIQTQSIDFQKSSMVCTLPRMAEWSAFCSIPKPVSQFFS